MKLQQHPVFQPITITLETSEEAVAFWEILGSVKSDHGAADALACRISNWLSEHAQLGGKQPTKGRDCGTPFQFMGLKPGFDFDGATVSLDGLEANIGIHPRGARPNPMQQFMGYSFKSTN